MNKSKTMEYTLDPDTNELSCDPVNQTEQWEVYEQYEKWASEQDAHDRQDYEYYLEQRAIELEQVVTFLWDLIDDIDTATDIAKSDDVWFRKRTEVCVSKRWATGITTDGYTLDISNLTTVEYTDTFPDKQEGNSDV